MEQFIVTKTGVNFRTGPGTNYSVIKLLPTGTVVQVLEAVSGVTWYKGKLDDGTVGYISSLTQYVAPYVPEWLTTVTSVKDYGAKYLGVPYEFGSSRSNDTTFDCSDFQQWIYEHAVSGYDLHADSRSQCANDGVEVSIDDIRSGDLVFFSHDGTDGGVYHVAQYVYPNKILHTYSTTCNIYDESLALVRTGGGGVTFSDFAPGKYWRNIAYKIKRIVQD